MKIVFINNLYQPYTRGGAEQVVEARARQATERGDEAVVVTLAKDKSEHNQVFWNGKIKVIRIYPKNIFSYFDLNKHNYFIKLVWHFIDIFGSSRDLQQILLSEKPNLIESHNLIGLGVHKVHKVLKSIKSDVKWNNYLHDVQLVEPSGVLAWDHQKDNILQKIYSGIMKRKFRLADEVISPSLFLQNFYKDRGFFSKSKWQKIGLSPLERGSERMLIRRSISQPPLTPPFQGGEIMNFLFVGSLVEHKGIRVLMNAWNLSNDGQHPPSPPQGGNLSEDVVSVPSLRGVEGGCWLNIVGDGDLRAEVEEWAKNKKNVQVFGRLEGEQLENIYKHSDILIMPSICLENCPTVILEAQKYGLQIIASDTGGVRELVDEESLFEPGSVEELVKKIKEKSR